MKIITATAAAFLAVTALAAPAAADPMVRSGTLTINDQVFTSTESTFSIHRYGSATLVPK